jgi:trigger factor
MNQKAGKKKLTDLNENPEKYSATSRPSIPSKIAREVRQRCGFGCVVCGLPLYEYEHMNEWVRVKEHVAADMTLLCDRHHREKTGGLLGIDRLRQYNASPHNKKSESSPFLFHAQPSTITILFGNNIAKFDQSSQGPFIILSISAKPVLWFNLEDGNLLLNLTLYNRKDEAILKIRDNELIYSTEQWDITLIGKTLTIHAAARKIILVLTVSPNENLIAIERAQLRYGGYEVYFDQKNGMDMPNSFNGVRNCIIEGAGHIFNYGGIALGVGMNFPGTRSY